MAWVKLDDGYPEHSKVTELSDAAFRTDIEGNCFTSRSRRDGHIPSSVARRMWKSRVIEELVAARRWHDGFGCGSETCIRGDGSGYVVHDFLAYNPTAAKRNATSAAASNASRIRWGNADEEPDEGTSQALSVLGDGDGGGVEKKKASETEPPEFVEFYERAYPRREGRGAARKAWAKAIAKAPPDVIIAAARRYAEDPNREPAYTAHASTWLNQERWADDPLPPRGVREVRDPAAAIAGGNW